MAQHNTLGIAGEHYASTELSKKGYTILEKNWRFKRDEIDLIIESTDTIAFVEVKTRTNRYAGEPESTVNISKQRRIVRAAQAYIDLHNTEKELRFDIVAIIMNSKETSFKHIENAFYPH